MEAIEAVVEVVKANEEMSATLDLYDSWFETLIGKTVTIAHQKKKKTIYVMGEVEEFESGEGWLVRDVESDDMFELTFEDFASGRAWIVRTPEPVPRPKRTVTFEDE
jgi:hypothetical protein